MAKLGPDLHGPVAPELARAEEQLPGPNGMPGGSRIELKWDGFLHSTSQTGSAELVSPGDLASPLDGYDIAPVTSQRSGGQSVAGEEHDEH